MIIKEIELNDFKQYYGKQTLTFAGADRNEKNVTVIYGQNGRGKTTLYRALLFGLYGDTVLEQDNNFDKNTKPSNIYIANLKALDEDSLSNNKGIEVSVRITFSHDDEEYEIKRKIKSIQDKKGTIYEEPPNVKMTIKLLNGNTEVYEEHQKEEIQQKINKIINEKVKDYFLFDGERIERLTKASNEQRKEVAKGIRNLLKIDNLFTVQDSIKMLCSNINKDLQKFSTGDYLKKLKEIDSLNNKIKTVEERLIDLDNELLLAEQYKTEINNELEKFNDGKEIIEKIKSLEKSEEEAITLKSNIQGTMGKFTKSASILMAKDAVHEIINYVDEKRAKGEVPSEIKKELIERLLNEMSCICGREFTIGSEEYKRLTEWNKQTNSQVFEQSVMSFFGGLNKASQFIEDKSEELIDLLTRFGTIEENLDTLEIQIKRVKDEAGEVPDYDFKAKTGYRNELIEKILTIKGRIETETINLGETKKILKIAQQDRDKLSVNETIQINLAEKLKIAEDSLTAIDSITNNFIREIKEELENKANHIMNKLLDEEGSRNIKKILVKDDYTLEILDWKGRPFLANISAGQRQVVSLSFITALAQVAGGSNMLEIPLFMDTPFGRLHGEHRDNLLELIPSLTPQWVLLATGTEFTSVEAKKLMETGKWGKYYILETKDEGVTKVRSEKPENFKPIR